MTLGRSSTPDVRSSSRTRRNVIEDDERAGRPVARRRHRQSRHASPWDCSATRRDDAVRHPAGRRTRRWGTHRPTTARARVAPASMALQSNMSKLGSAKRIARPGSRKARHARSIASSAPAVTRQIRSGATPRRVASAASSARTSGSDRNTPGPRWRIAEQGARRQTPSLESRRSAPGILGRSAGRRWPGRSATQAGHGSTCGGRHGRSARR